MSIWQDFKDAFSKKNNELIQIILVNVVVFLFFAFFRVILLLSGKAELYSSITGFLKLPADLLKFVYQPWSLLTYMFMHEDIFHILFNMLFLYWFGSLIAEYIGGSRVTNLYILGGLVGGILFVSLFNLIPYFKTDINLPLLGASGGVYAVVLGAATLLPNYEFRLILLGYVKIKYIALFYVLLSFIQIGSINSGGNIAHVGGALIGYLYIRSLQRGTDLGAWIQSVLGFFRSIIKPEKRPTLSKRKFFSEATVKQKAANQGTQNGGIQDFSVGQDEIDAILDKIGRSGYESLSKEEKQKLFKASKQD